MTLTPTSCFVLLVLAACAEGVLAADDIDETVAVIVFAVLIVIFGAVAVFFLFMIIKLKREQRSGTSRTEIDGIVVRSKRNQGIVRINSDHGITKVKSKQEPGLHAVSEEDTNSYPSTVTNCTFDHQTSVDPLLGPSTFGPTSSNAYNNPTYSAQVSQTSEITVTVSTPGGGLPTVSESPDPSNSPPDYYQLYDKEAPPSSGQISLTVSNSSEEKKEASVEAEKPHPPAETLESQNTELPHLNSNNSNSSTTDHMVTTGVDMATSTQASSLEANRNNGAAGISVDTTTSKTLNGGSPKPQAKVSPSTKKKGLRALFSKERPRRDSQKPLLNSQSSTTTPGDSPPKLTSNSTADLPETFDEEEEQAANFVYIPPIEETTL